MGLYDSRIYLEDLDTAIEQSPGIEEMARKSILITGASGLIGSFIVDILMRYNKIKGGNIKVYAAGRSIEHLSNRFNQIRCSELKYVRYDALEPLRFNFGVDYIIHAAGNAYPAAFNGDPVGTIIATANGTYNLLEYGRTHGAKRFLFVSSGEVYGKGNMEVNEFDEEYSRGELDSMAPRSSYPSSKRTAETLCASYGRQYGLDTVVVRPCHTYGPTMTKADNRASAQFINNALNGEDIILKSTGTQVRSYCYVVDCGSAILAVLMNGIAGEAYNCSNPNAKVSIAGFAQIVASVAGRKVIQVEGTDADFADRTFIPRQVLNSQKIEKLGWKGRFNVQSGVAHTLGILNEQAECFNCT